MSVRIGLFLILMSVNAAADERCLSSETPRQCLRRLIATRAYETAKAELAAVTTGPSAASSPVRTALKDFLSTVSAHVDQSTVKDSGTSLTLGYNLRQQFNLEVTLTDPALSPLTAFAVANDPPGTALLKEALAWGDDVAASVSFSPATQRFGRSLDPDRALFDSMLFALVSNEMPISPSIPASGHDTPFTELLPDAASRMTAMAEFETASIAALPAIAERLTQDLGRLASNQPQLFGTARYHYREPALGVRERGYRVTWEIGTDNLNSFRRNGGRDCEASGTCLIAFNDYAARTAARHRSERLSLSIEYRATETNKGVLTPPVVEKATHSINYAAAYGREITSFLSGKQGRIDLAVSYDGNTAKPVFTSALAPARISSDATSLATQGQFLPPPTTRFSAAATLTQPLSGGLSGLLSVVWQDRVVWFPAMASQLISPQIAGSEAFRVNERSAEIRVGIRYQPSVPRPPSPTSQECCCCK